MLMIHTNCPLVRLSALWALLLSASVCSLHAEEFHYVSDQVTLRMYQDTSLSKALTPLKAGDRVVILKHDDGYAQVRTEDDTVGWVKSTSLDKDKPAIIKLAEVQKELDDLRSKHTDLLIEQPVAQPPQDEGLIERLEAAESAHQNMKTRLTELEAQRMSYMEQLRELRQKAETKTELKDREKLLWIILPILTLISGFFIGFKYLEGKVKARFGGYNPL
jgi:SH3 domain protein